MNENFTNELKSHRAKELSAGFTLLETVLVVATFSFLFVISVPLYQSFQVRNNFYVTIDNIVQSLQRAQARATYMEGDSDWGVKIVTNSDKLENITVFKASDSLGDPSDFAGRDDTFDEIFYGSSTIEVTGDTELEFVFTKRTGELSVASGSICVTAPQIGAIEKLTTINKKGTINTTDDCTP